MRPMATPILLFLGLFFGATSSARAQAAFISRLGRDTVAVETYTRTGNLIRGTSVMRSPRTTVRRYELQLRADGAPEWLRIRSARPGRAIEETTEYTWRGDSVLGTFRRDTVQRRWAVAVAGRPLPYLEDIYAPWDIALRRVGPGRSLALVALRQVLRYGLQRGADGTVLLRLGVVDPEHAPLVARLDPARGLTALDMTATTTRYTVARVQRLNVEALAARHRVVLWGKSAESLAEYLTKGKQIYVEGRLQTRQWDDKDGNKRYTTEIRGDRIVLLGGGGGGGGGRQQSRASAAPVDETMGEPVSELTDDDIPF